jgi:hypothetical protein
MNGNLMRFLTVIAATVGSASTGLAQQNAPMPTPIVEIFACNLNDGSDMADLNVVTTRFNGWADRNNVADYTAFLARPWVYSADLPYDVLWLGAWQNGTAMAQGETLYMTQGEEIAAAFEEVIDCPAHSLYASVGIREPDGPPPQSPVAVFRDCTLRDGRTVPEALDALGQWSEHTAGLGASPFTAALFALGGLTDEQEYTFKAVEGFDSMEALGEFMDVYTAGAFMRAEEIFGRIMECNSPRIYMLTRVRAATPPSG